VFRESVIVARRRRPTPPAWGKSHLASLLPTAAAGKISAVIISSVVPRLDRALAAAVAKNCALRPHFVSHRSDSGIHLKIDRPAQLGADRIADCAGALSLFPPPLIVIDSGTATTFDLINRRGEYCGGCILPGLAIAARSLAESTAKLRPVALRAPRSPLGTNTADSIRAGIYFGHVGALRHLIACYRGMLGPRARVVATGGMLRCLKEEVPGIDAFEPDLIFHGLRCIHERRAWGGGS
ncbi:MAG: type III pantothenate kinase, partial [Candidatus Aminicenantes bacterium]|nr:type III pantothenate kinase [Candidatus Aminicenantes bacterium]